MWTWTCETHCTKVLDAIASVLSDLSSKNAYSHIVWAGSGAIHIEFLACRASGIFLASEFQLKENWSGSIERSPYPENIIEILPLRKIASKECKVTWI